MEASVEKLIKEGENQATLVDIIAIEKTEVHQRRETVSEERGVKSWKDLQRMGKMSVYLVC